MPNRRHTLFAAACLLLAIARPLRAQTYFPPAGSWEHRTPAQVGLSQAAVDSAVKIAIANESTSPATCCRTTCSHSAASRSVKPWVRSGTAAARQA